MTRTITLFGKDLSTLSFNELKREKRCHTWLLTRIKLLLKQEYKLQDEKCDSQIRQDKIAFLEMYKVHLEAMAEECDHWLARRYEPESNAYHRRPKKQIRAENEVRRKRYLADNARRYKRVKADDGFKVSWDREKFFLIATDRGYQTEEAVASAVGKALKIDRARVKWSLNDGRFTWGQVLVLGSFFEMTPKEFADTFMANYFQESYGEFRADVDEMSKQALLKQARLSDPLYGIPEETIEVDSDGRPIEDEEWWEE